MTVPIQVAPARVNFESKFHAMFQYGPTKCAVILKNMVDIFDKEFNTNLASKNFGRAFGEVDKILDLVTLKYKDLSAKRKKGNTFQVSETGGFMEHLVHESAYFQWASRIQQKFPNDMANMFLTVVREKINIRKAALGVAPAKAGVDYTTSDVVEWSVHPKTLAARDRFKINMRKNTQERRYFSNDK